MKRIALCLLLTTVALSGAAWAQNGKPLTLDECIAIALRGNSTLLNAQRRLNVAGTQVTTARAGVLPSVDLSLSSGRFRQGDRTRIGDVQVGEDSATGQILYERRTLTQAGFITGDHSAGINASMPLFDFGYLKERQLLAVYEDAVKSSDEQLKRTESMYEIGSVAQGDVFRQRTQLGNDRINLITQQNQVRNARSLLNVALGRPPDAELDIIDMEALPDTRTYTLEEVLNVAIDKNPDLQSYKLQMRSAGIGKSIARTAYLPSFSLYGSYRRSHNEFGNVYSDFDKNWNGAVGVDVRLNLFNGFSDQANLERESLNYRIAEEDYTDRLRNIRLEAEQALLSLQAWQEITAINTENLNSAQEDLRLAQERYRVGAGTLLDIITAQANLTRARSTLVSAKYDSMIANAQLKASMGTLGQ